MDQRHNLQYIEISRGALRHNLCTIRQGLSTGCRVMAVVKSNAYGHGMLPIARWAVAEGADLLGVNCLEEGRSLREDGCTAPIVVLGYIPLALLQEATDASLIPVLYNSESLTTLANIGTRQNRVIPFHLKVETGVHRQGVMERDLPRFLELIRVSPSIHFAGVSMHFANIEDTTDQSFAQRQLDAFIRLMDIIRSAGFNPEAHAACSAAAILLPATHFQIVRVGISMYGLWPSRETFLAATLSQKPPPAFQPVLSWKTMVAQVKRIPAGSHVGYGCSWLATRDSTIAVIPVGYADGYDRRLSSLGTVLVRGHRAPVVGRICMNMFMVDATDVPHIQVEDEVVLIGQQKDAYITVDELARTCQTIHYEMVARLSPQIPRLCVES